jgi:hypothetical protein
VKGESTRRLGWTRRPLLDKTWQAQGGLSAYAMTDAPEEAMQGFLAWMKSVFASSDATVAASPDRGVQPADAFESAVSGHRVVTVDGYKVELDLTRQVLAITAPPDREWLWDDDSKRDPAETPLSAVPSTIDSTDLVSASVLAHKAKVFDDGLYAAVEIAAQEGAGRHPGKAELLTSLGRALAGIGASEAKEVQELLLGAARLGHVPIPDVPRAVETRVQSAVEEFLADEARAKPIGFYTWSGQLASIFQQDRMLQAAINDLAGVEVLTNALCADTAARATYEGHLRLVSRLTNPFATSDLRRYFEARDLGTAHQREKDVRFLPPSVSHESEIVKKLYGDRSIPEGFVLVDEMIRRIRSRELDLEPRTESGWYDYQTWALEALVIPERVAEATRLELDDGYKKLLQELFKGLLTLTRETHIKQLEMPFVGASLRRETVHIDIAPALSAEPLATFYLRRALGYRYVRGVLEDAFGAGHLEQLRRLTPDGPVPTSLAEELSGIEALFLGAHASVSRELGLLPDAASGLDPFANGAPDRFADWVREHRSDPDLSLDLRAMVPVFYDSGRRKIKVWVFLGWSSRPINVSFARPPRATILDLGGKRVRRHPPIRWGTLHARLPYPVTDELYVDRILDRNEFRSLCDSCGTRSEIMKRLVDPIDAVNIKPPTADRSD